MKKILTIFLFLNLFFFSFSQKLVDISDYVNDYAGMISYDTEQKIKEKFIQLEESDSTQIVFVTINSLDGYPIEEYSIKLAEKFKIGQKKKDNGVIFLVSKEDRKMRIEVGFGLEGVLTDLLSARIINNIVAPKFKEGDYDGGFIACADELINAVKGEYKNDGTSPLPTTKSKDNDGILFVTVVFAYLIARFFSLFIKNNPLVVSGIGGVGGMVIPLLLGVANFFIMLLAGILAFFISFIPFSTLLMIFLLSGGSGGGRGRSGGGFSSGASGRSFSGGGGGFGGGGASGGW